MAKIHCHSLLSGSSWSSFDEDSSEEEPEAMEVDENNSLGLSEATRLRCEDMNLYGLCPAQEQVCLVVCKECMRAVKLSCFTRHCDVLHKKAIPPPTPSPEVDSPVDLDTSPRDAAIKIEQLELEDSSVKIEEVPLTVPKVNHVVSASSLPSAAGKKSSSTNRKSPRKVIPTREREFDADKHCGVWVQEQQKRCTRSLTCKTHALSLRRAVPGRRKKFDELLAEHKARVNCEKEQQNLASLKLLESKSTEKNNVLKATAVKIEPSPKLSNDNRYNMHHNLNKEEAFNPINKEADSDEESLLYNELTTINQHPKPLVTCSFGSKRVGHGTLVFNRRQDHLRCAMLAMVERYLNPSTQRKTTGRPGAAAILHRPTIKTIGQSSNHNLFKGSSVVGDKTKSHSSSHKNLSNFLKAPPPPRNRSVKHNNVAHGNLKHCVENSTVYQTSNVLHSKQFLDSSTNLGSSSDGFLKPDASSQAISDMGSIIASIDNPRTLSAPNLDANLNLCSSLGLNSEVAMSGTRTAFTTIYTTINNSNTVSVVQTAPMVAKISGSVSSGGTSSNTVVQLAGQVDQAKGKVSASTTGQRESPLLFSTQNSGTVQVASSLPNGTSPPPIAATSVKGYPAALSFVIQGSKGGTNQSPVSFTKGHSLVFNSMGMAQMQQPSSPSQHQQLQQKGKVLLRANSYPKTNSKANNSQVKIPQSLSPQQQLSPGQPIIVTSPPPGQQYLNHQHITNAPQPIVQLKQQVEQQQQQLQQITLQQQLQQQQLQQQQLQQHKQLNSQFVNKQLPIQPRLAPAPHPPSQSLITQQQLGGQNIVIKATDQPLKSPQNTVFVTTDSHQNMQASVVHNKPQSNVA